LEGTWARGVVYALKRSALVLAWRGAPAALAAVFGRPSGSQRFESHLLAGTPDPQVEGGWEQVGASLGAMAALARERGIDLTLVSLPRRDQVVGATDGNAYERRLASIVASKGLRFVDALPPLQRAFASHGQGLFVPWGGHNAGPANREIALAAGQEFLDRTHELRR